MAVYESVCITGASRGIGLELVRQFLHLPQPPRHLFAICRNPDSAKELQDLHKSHSEILHLIELDITNEQDYDRVVYQVRDKVGQRGLNLLINNAGVYNSDMQGITSFTKQELMRHYEVNTVSPMLLTRAFYPLLKLAANSKENSEDIKKSVVTFITSKLGCFYPNIPKNSPYRFSKAALNMLIHCLGNEWREEGILVAGIHPGLVKTDMAGSAGVIEVTDSASGILNILLNASESNRGRLFQYDGTAMDW